MQLRSNIARLHRTDRPPGAPFDAQVRAHLDGLLASPHFDASSRSREFLRYVVDETLAGRGAALTQSAIAIGVFRRQADFDPVLDPIVRVQAGRLRRSLERYYLLAGEPQSVRIALPKGSYAPIFATATPTSVPFAARAPQSSAAASPCWPALLVHAFEISTVPDDEIASLLTEELTIELQRHGNVHVVRQRDMDRLDVRPRDTLQFELRGRVRRRGERVLISARLIDRLTAEQIWSDEFSAGPAPESWCASADDVARAIAARIGGEYGVIPRAAAGEHGAERLPHDEASRWILQCWQFFLAGRPELFPGALEAARRLSAHEPRQCARAAVYRPPPSRESRARDLLRRPPPSKPPSPPRMTPSHSIPRACARAACLRRRCSYMATSQPRVTSSGRRNRCAANPSSARKQSAV